MPLKFGTSEVERVAYNSQINAITNAQVNVIKYIRRNDGVNETIFETNLIKAGNYTGNPTLTSLADEKVSNISFTSNNENFTTLTINSSYVKYGENNVYSYTNNSWAAVYKTLTITADTFVDQDVYDWFNVNFVKA